MEGVTEIFLIRHGESEWNEKRILQGGSDIPGLTEKGIKQSENLKNMLRVKFDVVYSSPLKRAYQTAKILSEGEIKIHKGLKERLLGELTGREIDEVKRENPELINTFMKTKRLYGVKGAESLEEFQQRIWNAFNEIVKENEGKKIAIVFHGDAIRSIFSRLLGFPVENINLIDQKNCCVNKIVSDGKKFKILYINIFPENHEIRLNKSDG